MTEETTTGFSGLAETVANGRRQPLDWRDKAVQQEWYGRTTTDVVAGRPTLDGLSTPVMTLDRGAIDQNIATMHAWCEEAGLLIAPHGKTTMSPELWREQLEGGAWGITVANEPQLRVARGAGVPRVIVVNLLLGAESLAWLNGELDSDEEFEVYCWVDSVESVKLMNAALQAVGAKRPVNVLIEVGALGARTGTRTHAEGMRVAQAVVAAPTLALSGVSGFEGAVGRGVDADGIAVVDVFLTRMVDLHRALLDRFEVEGPLLSGGGSKYFDRISAILAPERGTGPGSGTRVVVRSGAYVVHDDGLYREATPSTRNAGPVLRAAMHVWARVISIPEPGLAFLDAGKRDVPYDSGLPELQFVRQRDADGNVTTRPLTGHELINTNDQHAYVRLPENSPIHVGDVVRLGLSHPCTAFDKWSLIVVVDDASVAEPVVVDLIRTYF